LAANYRHIITPPCRLCPGHPGRMPIGANKSMVPGEIPPGKWFLVILNNLDTDA